MTAKNVDGAEGRFNEATETSHLTDRPVLSDGRATPTPTAGFGSARLKGRRNEDHVSY